MEWDPAKGVTQGGQLFELCLVAAQPGPLRLCTGVSIVPQSTIA